MRLNQTWHCREIGEDGWVRVVAHQRLMSGIMVSMSCEVHPFCVDLDPRLLAEVIGEMSEVMGRVGTPMHSDSRACAFGDRHEAAARA